MQYRPVAAVDSSRPCPAPRHPAPWRSATAHLLLLLVLVLAPLARLDAEDLPFQPDETLPGFKPGGVYDTRGVDSVNVFSGDLNLAIPLGPEYPLSPGLTWQLKAYYTAKHWQMESYPAAGGESTCTYSNVLGTPTLGTGWTLDLGHVGDGAYRSPDGGRHYFFTTDDGLVTRDGTNLRITAVPGGGSKVWFPDGSAHVFTHRYRWPRPVSGSSLDLIDYFPVRQEVWSQTYRFALTEIIDRFGRTVLRVEYVAADDHPDAFKVNWITLTPDTNPQRIEFTWDQQSIACGSTPAVVWPVLSTITFPTAAGSLTARFVRNPGGSGGPTCLPRRPRDNARLVPTCLFDQTDEAAVPILDEISLSGADADPVRYRFHSRAGDWNDRLTSGLLDTVTVPTGGRISYSYGTTSGLCTMGLTSNCGDPESDDIPSQEPSAGHPEPGERMRSYLDSSPAVETRAETDPVSPGSPTSTTQYRRKQFIKKTYSPDEIHEDRIARAVLVISPSGNGGNFATRYVFHVSYAEEKPDQTVTGSGIELVRRYYDGENVTGTPARSIVSCYEADEGTARCGYWGFDGWPNSYLLKYDVRQQKEVTWYGPNPTQGGDCSQSSTPCEQLSRSAYSSAAREYEVATLTHTLPGPAISFWPGTRVWTTTWTPLADADHWMLKRKSWEKVSDPAGLAPNTVETLYGYSSTVPGFLTSVSRTDPRGDYGSTVTRVFTPDGYGNPETETLSGTGGVEGTFVTLRTFSPTGLLSYTTRDGVGYRLFDVVRDATTGLVTLSRDPNPGLSTGFGYDTFGRLTISVGSGEWPTRYCYSGYDGTANKAAYVVKRTSTSPPSWPGCKVTNDGVPTIGSGPLEAFQYDGFGRLVREVRRLPNTLSTGSYLSVRQTRYDAAGHDSFVSEWTPCLTTSGSTDLASCFATETTLGTTRSDFDPFGRPRQVVAADGATTTISYQDGSVAHSDTLQTVTVHGVGPGSATTTTRRDALGRVVEVSEPAVGGSVAGTVYGYVVTDKLAGLLQPDFGGQVRQFDWDVHGFLRNERHPEIRDARGENEDRRATLAYPGYDALGNALEKRVIWPAVSPDPKVTHRTFLYDYDALGRLETLDVDGKRYLENRYDGVGYTGQNPLGRLTQRIGFNFDKLGAASGIVTESFDYGSASGRLAFKQTLLSTPALTADERWTYGWFGQLASHAHPQLSSVGTRLNETYTYKSGFLTKTEASENGQAAQAVVSSATYGPSGSLASYTTANGVVTTIEPDPWGRPRPRRISTAPVSGTPFDTGLFGYDGDGNVTAIGGDSFTYDARSRLIGATVYSASGSIQHTETLGHDAWGNISSWTRDGLSRSPDPDPVTNRLRTVARSITYDGMGNLTKHGSGSTYSYDLLSRQVAYRDTIASVDDQYLYDGAGERVVRIGAITAPLTLVNPGTLTATAGTYFSHTFTAMGGTQPLTWSTPTQLPAGLALGASTGQLSGTPLESGIYFLTIVATDAFGSQQTSVTLTVAGQYLFFPLTPCRLVDTRLGAAAVHTGPPAIPNGGQRDFLARGHCGVAGNAQALAVNVTSVLGPGDGYITSFATGLVPPPVVTTAVVRPGYVSASRVDVQLNARTGSFSLAASLSAGSGADAIVDVFGYFARPGGQMAHPSDPRPLTGAGWSRAMPLQTGGTAYVTLRDQDQRLQTELVQVNQLGTVNVAKDYFYLGNLQVATLERLQSFSGWKFYASDHLGTPRIETSATGQTLGLFKYWPYGERLPETTTSPKLGFASMELDSGSWNHYDHARFYRGVVGRFTSVDAQNGRVEDPASWNRYAYARNNPLKYVDPDGRRVVLVGGAEERRRLLEAA
ncbi:MAG: hypothetical protein DYH06_06945 [Acidobacteria bacterium ACB2]|nr:hypothetical protein [Acidobacteria bacterium ACB2]